MKQHSTKTLLGLLLTLSLNPVLSNAEEIVFQAGKSPDATYTHSAVSVWSEWPNSTSKSEGDLMIGNNKKDHVLHGLVAFDLSAIPQGSKVEAVELKFYQTSDPHSPSGPVELLLLAYNDYVVENSTCWRDAEGQYGEQVGLIRTDPTLKGYFIFKSTPELVALAQDSLDSGFNLNMALKLADESFDGRRVVLLRGNEYSAEKSRPQLTIRYSKGN